MRNPLTGQMQKAEVIDIVDIKNEPVIVELSDGSTLRLKMDVIEVVRFDGVWDIEGHPIYNVKSGSTMAVLDSDLALRRK
jgi:hypothetical protein